VENGQSAEDIRLLRDRGAALRAAGRIVDGYGGVAVRAVEGGDAMAPPELAGDRPVVDVLHPVEVGGLPRLRENLDGSVADHFDGRRGQRLDLYEPLPGDHRLDVGVALAVHADGVGVLLDLRQEALLFEEGHDVLAGHVAIETFECGAGGRGHLAVFADDLHLRQVVAEAGLVVVLVVGRGDFDDAGAEGRIDQDGVADHRDAAVHDRQRDELADQLFVAVIVRMDGHGCVAEHRLRPGGGHGQAAVRALDRVVDVPQLRVGTVAELDLDVGDGGAALGAPVDHGQVAVDQSVFVELHEDMADGAG
jgi:hypothetical protein